MVPSRTAKQEQGAGIHSHYISVGEDKSNFDAEIQAIHLTLQQFLYR